MTFHERFDSGHRQSGHRQFGHRQSGRWVRWWSECWALGRGMWDLVADWLNRDRIRIAPTVGRLLGLREQDRILLLNDVYTVQQRVLSGNVDGVVYQLVTEGVFAVLTVSRDLDGRGSEGCLEVGTFRRAVFDDDVAVLSERVA